jgi:hypothetical protein
MEIRKKKEERKRRTLKPCPRLSSGAEATCALASGADVVVEVMVEVELHAAKRGAGILQVA